MPAVRNPRIVVVDRSEELTDQVRQATASARPRLEVIGCRLAQLDAVLGEGPVDVVIAGPALVGQRGLSRLRQLRVEHPTVSLVMAAEQRPQASFREIVRAGAVDILHLPMGDDDLAQAVAEAVDIARRAQSERLEAPRPALGPVGTVFTIVSASGGSGKTFLATNLAYHLHTRLRKRTCLVDLDLQFGELSSALRLRPRYTISDALHREDGDEAELAAHMEDYVAAHDTGVFVLASPTDPVEADAIGASDVIRVVSALRSRFDAVVVDTPAFLSEAVLACLDLSERVVAVATLDLPSVRNLSTLLTTFKQLKVPEEHLRLVMNKVETDVGIDVEQVNQYFPQGFSGIIPYGKEVSRSLNMGMPILAFQPGADVCRALSEGLAKIVPGEMQDGAEPDPDGGRRARRHRKDRTK